MNNKVILGIIVAVIVVVAGVIFTTRTQTTPQTTPQPQSEEKSTPEATETGTSVTKEGAVKEFTISGSPFKFDVPKIMVKVGDTVRVTFKNTQGTHDFSLDEFGVKTKRLAAGDEETVDFVADQKGTFNFYCSVPGHRTSGMEGQLIVE